MHALIDKIESFATHEGSGIRYAVFFHGCNLRCNFCHNPEMWEGKAKLKFDEQKLVKKVLSCKPYFMEDGGVTLTGGEPLIQTKFLMKFCKLLKRNNINIALDTAGSLLDDNVKKLLKDINTVFLDLKYFNEREYKKYSKGSLKQTLEFLNYLQTQNINTVLRTVIVPGFNDNIKSIKKYFNLIKKYKCVSSYELLGFHTMGFSKYEELNIVNPLLKIKALKEEKLNKLQQYLNGLLKF